MMFSMIANASLMSARWTHEYIYIHQFTPPIGMAVHPHSTVSALQVEDVKLNSEDSNTPDAS